MPVLIPDLLWSDGRFRRGLALEYDAGTGVIVRVGPAETLGGEGGTEAPGPSPNAERGRSAGGTVERLPGRALLPGFVNAHSHAFQRLMRGRTQWRPASAPHADFWSWREAMYHTALTLSPEDVFHVSRFCFLEMLRAGITAVGEFHYLHRDRDGRAYADPNELAHRVIAAANDVGIRVALLNVCYATGDIGRPLRPEQRRFATPALDDYLAATQALLDRYGHRGGVGRGGSGADRATGSVVARARNGTTAADRTRNADSAAHRAGEGASAADPVGEGRSADRRGGEGASTGDRIAGAASAADASAASAPSADASTAGASAAGASAAGPSAADASTADASSEAVSNAGPGLVTVGVAPHSLRAVPRPWLRELHTWAAERDVAFHMHVSEQTREVEACLEAYGARPVQMLAEEGIVDGRLTAVHATHLTAEEVGLLGDAGATVCACPTTERDLGDGFLPGAALLQAGARIALGSDSHTVIDPLEEVRLIEYHERLRQRRRVVLAVPDQADRIEVAPLLIELATQAGAHSLGIDGGRLEPGTVADLVAIDLEHPALAGWTDRSLAAMLTLSAPPDVVADVWVGGVRRLDGRRHPLDAEATATFREVAGRTA